MIVLHPIVLKGFRQLLTVVDEFGAARPQRRTDTGLQVFRITAVVSFHLHDGFTDDISHSASPTAVDGPNHIFDRIEKKHCLTVGLLNH